MFYCDEAEKMLAEQISGGLILKKSAEQCQQAGHSPRGFPFFHCSETGKSKTGLPKSFEDLCRELGISPHDSSTNHSSHHSPTPSSGSDNVCKVWVMKGCHWCKLLVEEIEPLIKANKCKVIQHNDTSEPAPASAKGFPHSTNKGKKVSGYMPKNEFVKALEIDMNETTQENFEMDNVCKVWVMKGCHWCKLLVEEIEPLIKANKCKVIQHDDTSEPAPASAKGFPHSTNKGKKVSGYMPKNEFVKALEIDMNETTQENFEMDNVCKVWVMKGCHWCKLLVEEIEPLIKANKCKVIQHDDTSEPAPASAKGFPHSTNKGKKVSGYMPKNEFVKALEIDVNETTQENFKMAQLQQTLYQNEIAKQQMEAHFRENFEQKASVPPSATTEKAVAAAQDKRNQSATTACSKYNNTDMRSCEGSSGQQTCHWNEATNKCGLFNPHSASQVIDQRNCRPGNCPPLKAEPPQQFRRIMLEGGEVAWVDEFDLVGPDAFTMLAFSGCESDGNESGGCKSSYSMFGVL